MINSLEILDSSLSKLKHLIHMFRDVESSNLLLLDYSRTLLNGIRQGIHFQNPDYKTKIMCFENRVTETLAANIEIILYHVKHPQQEPEK